MTDAKDEAPILLLPDVKTDSLEKTLMLRKIEVSSSEKKMTEDEMVGWHHQLNPCEFEQTLGDDEGQGILACYSPSGCKE